MTKCKTCKQDYSPACDYRQGRCPGHPSLWEQIKQWWSNRK